MKIRVSDIPHSVLNLDSIQPVEVPDIYDKTGHFHPKGIFSEQIFGPVRSYQCQCGMYEGKQFEGVVCENCGVKVTSSDVRRTTYSYIKLPRKIPHPLALHHIFNSRKQLKDKFLSSDMNTIDEILKILESDSRPDILNTLEKRHALFTDVIPVIPPDLRPMLNKYKSDDINKFYIQTLHYITKQSLNIEKPLIFTLAKYAYELFLYAYNYIPKKTGLIRQALLGKETDFSARTVIAPDPTLPIDTVSVPKIILYELLRPLIIYTLMQNQLNPTYVDDLIDRAVKTNTTHRYLDQALEDILAVQDIYVALNRQPTLHRGSLMTFRIIPNDDMVIKINPVVCTPYNADFDGDTILGEILVAKEPNGKLVKVNIEDLERMTLAEFNELFE